MGIIFYPFIRKKLFKKNILFIIDSRFSFLEREKEFKILKLFIKKIHLNKYLLF